MAQLNKIILTGGDDAIPRDVAILLKEVFSEKTPPKKANAARAKAKRSKKQN